MTKRNWQTFIGLLLLGTMVTVALLGPVLYRISPFEQDLRRSLEGPSPDHPLGTDELGRDLLSRIIHGLGITLLISFSGVFLGGAAGSLLGLTAGYFGGWWDHFATGCTEVLMAIPGFLLALVIAITLKSSPLNLSLAVAIFTLPGFARILRAKALELREQEYVIAAGALGARRRQILRWHLLPNSLPLLYTLFVQRLSSALLTASGLSFLGLGPQPPLPELGSMLNTGREYLWVAPHLCTLPGIAITLCIIGFNLLGNGLQRTKANGN